MSTNVGDMSQAKRGRPAGLLLNHESVRFALGTRPQSWLASEAGISTAHLSEMLAGTKGATPEVAERIVKVLGAPKGMLFPESLEFRVAVRHFVASAVEAAA